MYKDVRDVLRRVKDVTEFLGVNLQSVNQKGLFGNNPLSVVMHWKDIDAFRILLDAGANIGETLEDGNTALHIAALIDNEEMVSELILRGAAVDVKNNDGLYPFDLASSKKVRDLLKNHLR